MFEGVSNKMQEADETKIAPVKAVAVSKLTTEFFYPPSNGYTAMTVIAASREEADTTYHATKKLVEPEKVEETKTEATQ